MKCKFFIRILLVSILFWNKPMDIYGQQQDIKEHFIIKGKVVDTHYEALAFANVYFVPEKKGTTTDFNGEFILKLSHPTGKLQVSMMGYQTQIVNITPQTKSVTVVLKEKPNVLNEVVIVQRPKKRLKKKENPAYRILKEIWKRKKLSGLKLAKTYEYKKYETTEVGLNRLDSTTLKQIFKKEYAQLLKKLPFDSEGFHHYIPVYIKEKVYHIYGDNKKKKYLTKTEAETEEGFYSQGFVFDRMEKEFVEVNLHQNNFSIFNQSFVSPISTTGFDTYDYVLYDSIQKNDKKYYRIYFFPRRKEDLAFEGNFTVSSGNFFINKIQMKLTKDANINFVRSASIEQEYTLMNDSLYLPKHEIFEADYTLLDKKEDSKGIQLKKSNFYSDFKFNKKYPEELFTQDIKKYAPNQFKKDSLYWEKYKPLTDSDKTYQLINEIKNKKRIMNFTRWINILTTGYINVSPSVQWGPVFQSIGLNDIEGIRFFVGFRTFKTQDDRFRIIGHLAYGKQDRKIKYALLSKYLLSYHPRIEVNFGFSDEYIQQGNQLMNLNQIMYTENYDANFVLSRGQNLFLSHIKEIHMKWDFKLADNFHLGFIPTLKNISSANRDLFKIDYLDQNNQIRSQVKDAGADFYMVYTPGRYVYGFGVEQAYGYNNFPTFVINFHKNFESLGADFPYEKIQFLYAQNLLLGKIGKLHIRLESGKSFGQLPLVLLSPIPANQILVLKPDTFTLLNYYDYVTDTYLVGHFEHHFKGFLLNRIPLIKKLKFRTVISFRWAYGQISDKNKSINLSDVQYAAPSDAPYYEYGVGLENIGWGNLRILRVDAIWRTDYTSINGLYSPKFAVRIGFQSGF